MIAALAREEGWKRMIIVTSSYQLSRPLLERCADREVFAVRTGSELSPLAWAQRVGARVARLDPGQDDQPPLLSRLSLDAAIGSERCGGGAGLRTPGVRPLYVRGVTEPGHVSTARAFYNATAEMYGQLFGTEVTPAIDGPVDRAFLAAFVECVAGATAGPVADVGCGPGRVAAFLAVHGLDVIGVDVSQAMLDVARAAHPGIRFEEGRLTALPLPDESLAGAVCWYSIMYTPPAHLDDVFAELERVLAGKGYLLMAFQAGGSECVHRADAYGTGLPLTSYRHSPDEVARQMTAAGLEVRARAIREPDLPHESTPQAFILARAASHLS